MELLDATRSHIFALPPLAKFAIVIAILAGVPPLARRLGLPEMVGLLLFGVVLGPHVLGLFGEDRPIANFFAELGKLLLMFSAGLEVDVVLFRKAQARAIVFGIFTTMVPLLLGTVFGLAFRYTLVPAIVVGSLLASHTLLGLTVVTRLGAIRLEPVIVTIGATVLSDTLSLIVFAVCVSTYTTGFSLPGLATQLAEIAVFVPLILVGLSRAGAYVLRKVQDNEDAYFVVMLGIMAVAGVVAAWINLPDIVGAFLAGLAVNAASRSGSPGEDEAGILRQGPVHPQLLHRDRLPDRSGDICAEHHRQCASGCGDRRHARPGKRIAAEVAGRAFGYTPAARLTMWALTLPQVAATLAAALVAHDTVNAAGQRMLDDRMLNAVLVLMLATSIFGPLLTERFAPACSKTRRARGDRHGTPPALALTQVRCMAPAIAKPRSASTRALRTPVVRAATSCP